MEYCFLFLNMLIVSSFLFSNLWLWRSIFTHKVLSLICLVKLVYLQLKSKSDCDPFFAKTDKYLRKLKGEMQFSVCLMYFSAVCTKLNFAYHPHHPVCFKGCDWKYEVPTSEEMIWRFYVVWIVTFLLWGEMSVIQC